MKIHAVQRKLEGVEGKRQVNGENPLRGFSRPALRYRPATFLITFLRARTEFPLAGPFPREFLFPRPGPPASRAFSIAFTVRFAESNYLDAVPATPFCFVFSARGETGGVSIANIWTEGAGGGI